MLRKFRIPHPWGFFLISYPVISALSPESTGYRLDTETQRKEFSGGSGVLLSHSASASSNKRS